MEQVDNEKEEGLGLEYLDRLTFFDGRFVYNKKQYRYSDVEHIWFTAQVTKHRTNFVPTGTTYEVDLFLNLKDGTRLQIKPENTFLGSYKKQRYEAVLRAASMLMNVTFNHRLEAYERHLEDKKFVAWGRHQIHRDGDIFRKNQFRLNIRDPDVVSFLEPFSVTFRKKMQGLSGYLKGILTNQDEIIDLCLDKDCFIYFMKNQFGLSWKDQVVPEKRKSKKQSFNEALLILGAKLCTADGHISSQEIALFKRYFGIDEESFPGAQKVFLEAAAGKGNGLDTAKHLYDLLEGQKEPLEYIVVGLMQIAATDGVFHEAETNFIRQVADVFSFSSTEIGRLFSIFAEFSKSQKPGDNTRSKETDTSLVKNLRILGLAGIVSFKVVKSAYREMARRHHPDLLRAQGVPVDDIANSEQILKVINGAFEWLEGYYKETDDVATH